MLKAMYVYDEIHVMQLRDVWVAI